MSTRRLATALLALGLALTLPLVGKASAAASRHVDVIQVGGLIDPVNADFITRSVAKAEADHADALVIQLDSRGGVVSDARMDRVALALAHATVPVAVWVGGSGHPRATGQAALIVETADVVGLAPKARVPATALRPGQSLEAPTLGLFIVNLDGRVVAGKALHTARVLSAPGSTPRRELTVTPVFGKPGLVARLLHGVASPSASYLLLAAGLLLAVFEFYSAGIGLAAGTGAICLVLSAYGLGVLPIRPWALVLIVLGVLGYAVDVQAGAPRFWTVVGTIAFVIGSLRLFHGLQASPLILAAVVAGTALFMVAGMPSMLRTRFSTPTIGREAMIGETGVATGDVAPEGTVEVLGAPWRARTNRSTPILAGAVIRVVGIDGLLLEVEPEVGGARDYRH
jgi:membrane-bound serine protease (ClpP class)